MSGIYMGNGSKTPTNTPDKYWWAREDGTPWGNPASPNPLASYNNQYSAGSGGPSNAPPLAGGSGAVGGVTGGTTTPPAQGIAGGTGGNSYVSGLAGSTGAATPAAAGSSGSVGGAAADTNTNQITVPYGASPIYSPAMTAHAVNQAIASNTPDPRFAQKGSMGHGQSLSAGTLGAGMPNMSQQLSTGQALAAQIPMSDYIANQENLLQGQKTASGFANQYEALLNTLMGMNNSYDTSQSGNSMALLAQLLGTAQ